MIYAPGSEAGLRFDDQRIGINWPMPPACISEKDQQYPYVMESYNDIQRS